MSSRPSGQGVNAVGVESRGEIMAAALEVVRTFTESDSR
jgi:hypothetical protein